MTIGEHGGAEKTAAASGGTIRDVARRLRRTPCKLMLATIAVCLAAREWYPLSPFPMYATFGPATWYVYVTDGDDRPVPTIPIFGQSAMPMRRMFEVRARAFAASGVDPAEVDTRAAEELLRFLVREAELLRAKTRFPPRLRLWRAESRLEAGKIVRSRDFLAEIDR